MKKSYVILTENNKWIATGNNETTEQFEATIADIKANPSDYDIEANTKLFVVYGEVVEIN